MDSFDRRTISGSASHFQALSDPFRISISPTNTGFREISALSRTGSRARFLKHPLPSTVRWRLLGPH